MFPEKWNFRKNFFFEIENFEKSYFFRKCDFSKNQNFQFSKIIFWEKYFLKIELWKKCHKKFSALTFEQMNIFLQIQKHMNRHDGVFHFRYWTSKTDQYTKSYPDFSLGGASNSGTQFMTMRWSASYDAAQNESGGANIPLRKIAAVLLVVSLHITIYRSVSTFPQAVY